MTASQPDMAGAVFFGLAAAAMAAMTRWPKLWVAISVNRRAMREELRRKERPLRILTATGCGLGVAMSLFCYFSPR